MDQIEREDRMKKQVTIIKPSTIDVERLPIDKKVFQALTVEEQREQLRKHYGPYAKDLPYETKLAEQLDVPNKYNKSYRDSKRGWEATLSTLKEFKYQDELHRRFNITRPYLKEHVKALAKIDSIATNTGSWRSNAEKVLVDVEPLPYGRLKLKEAGWYYELKFQINYEEARPIIRTIRKSDVKAEDLCNPEKFVEGWHGEWHEMKYEKEECHDVIEHYHRQVIMCLVLSQARATLKDNLGSELVAPGISLEPISYVPMHKYG